MRFDRLFSPLYEEAPGDGGNGGGGAPSSPEPLTLDAITKLFDQRLNGLDKKYGSQFKALEERFSKVAPPAPADPDPDPAPAGKGDPAIQRQLKSLQEKLDAAEKARLAGEQKQLEAERRAEEKERHAEVRSMLSKYPYANDAARDDAYSIFLGQIKRSEDGALVGPDDIPAAEYLDKAIKARPYLLAPAPQGGAGATPSRGRAAGGINLEDIKPGMSAEQRSAALAAIKAAQ